MTDRALLRCETLAHVTAAVVLAAIALAASAACASAQVVGESPRERLAAARSWFYYLDVNLSQRTVGMVADSDYDLVVIDPIVTERNNTRYPIRRVVGRLRSARVPKLVLAYVDIGQAESYRTYWKRSWRRDPPRWVVGRDPDGWVDNFPVAFWHRAWQRIWLRSGGLIDQVLDTGFDGIYLDWTEAYSDVQVRRRARRDRVDPRDRMVEWVRRLAERGRATRPEFLVINQNAAELPARIEEFRRIIDAQAQEQVWFDGAANDKPPGDCPLPERDADIESRAYVNSLSNPCRRLHNRYPDSTLHVSSEDYLRQLIPLRDAGLPVFTVDYALRPQNVLAAHCRARALGFVPFTSNRWLNAFRPVYPLAPNCEG
jgi:cysteinyl-tRNA synthetase